MVHNDSSPRYTIDPGIIVSTKVAASVANLGSGFDSIGLAVGMYDSIQLEVTSQGIDIHIEGHGADILPRDSSHLCVIAFLQGLKELRYSCPGIKLTCNNTIPQARGLGSSAATYVAGLYLASQVVQKYAGTGFSVEQLVNYAGRYEGHADNSSASILGGAVVSWVNDGRYQAVSMPIHSDIIITVFIPETVNYTSYAREILPKEISLLDTVFNVSRAALLPIALSKHTELLFDATDDRIHQQCREYQMPLSAQLVHYLRQQWGYPAMIGGAGPTVICLTTISIASEALEYAVDKGFTASEVPIGEGLGLQFSP